MDKDLVKISVATQTTNSDISDIKPITKKKDWSEMVEEFENATITPPTKISVATQTTYSDISDINPITKKKDRSEMVEEFENTNITTPTKISVATQTTNTITTTTSTTTSNNTDTNNSLMEKKNRDKDFDEGNKSSQQQNINNSVEPPLTSYANMLKNNQPVIQKAVSNFTRTFKVVAINVSFLENSGGYHQPNKIVLASLERFVIVDCTLTKYWNVIVRDILKEMKATDLLISGGYAWNLFMNNKILRDAIDSIQNRMNDQSPFSETLKFPCYVCKNKDCPITLAREALKRYIRKAQIAAPHPRR